VRGNILLSQHALIDIKACMRSAAAEAQPDCTLLVIA
jgi:hypothetical protein